MPSETRYMRSDQQTVNGLLAYILGTAQSAAAASQSQAAASIGVEATLRPNDDILTGFPNYYPPADPGETEIHSHRVDDVTPDDADTMVYTGESTSEVYDRYQKPAFTLPSGKKIAFIRVTCRGMTEYLSAAVQATFRFGVYIGTTYYMSAYKKTNGAWQTFTQDWVKNPATGLAWTQADINNLQIAVGGKSYYYAFEWYLAHITQIYVEIYTYTDATVDYWAYIIKRSSDGSETVFGYCVLWSELISSLYDSPGLKSVTWHCVARDLVGTDAIVVRVYWRVGGGAWNLVRNFITEQLGAQSLDDATWTFYSYFDIAVDTSYVYTVFWHGTATYNSRITNFTWTPVPPVVAKPLGDGLTFAI